MTSPTTPRDAIGLSERLREEHTRILDLWEERRKAATQLDALSARVKELEDDVRRLHSDKMGQFERAVAAESLVKELEAEQEPLVREVQRVNSQLADEMKRTTRAEQARDEAYERAAKVAEGGSATFDAQKALKEMRDCEVGFHSGRMAAAKAIRQLKIASGPDKESNNA